MVVWREEDVPDVPPINKQSGPTGAEPHNGFTLAPFIVAVLGIS